MLNELVSPLLANWSFRDYKLQISLPLFMHFHGNLKKNKLWSRNVLISSDPARHPLLGNTVLCATFGRGTLTDIYFFGYTYSHLGGMCTDSAILSQSQSPQSLS